MMRCVNLTVRWLWTVAGVLLAGLVATVVWGVSAAKFGGQSATESYILTCLLTLISISTGIVVTFIVSQHQARRPGTKCTISSDPLIQDFGCLRTYSRG